MEVPVTCHREEQRQGLCPHVDIISSVTATGLPLVRSIWKQGRAWLEIKFNEAVEWYPSQALYIIH
jgi:hypothetical protein